MMKLISTALDIQAFGCVRQGSSHRLAEPPVPCQDAHLIQESSIEGNSYIIAAVADGHGNPKHDRSALGAQWAVRAAASCFESFVLTSKESLEELLKNEPDQSPSVFLTKLFKDYPRNIVRNWKAMIESDLLRRGEEVLPDSYSRYGSTLLVSGITFGHLFFAKIGDGDIVLFSDERFTPEVILPERPEDGRLVGGVTRSLASGSALSDFQTGVKPRENVSAITLSTDGLSNAFEPEEFFEMLTYSVRNVISYGLKAAAAIIPDCLDKYSRTGSGDDITLVELVFDDSPDPPFHVIAEKLEREASEPEILTNPTTEEDE